MDYTKYLDGRGRGMQLDAYTQKRIDTEGFRLHSRHIMKHLAWEAAEVQQKKDQYTLIAYDYETSEHLLFVRDIPKQSR